MTYDTTPIVASRVKTKQQQVITPIHNNPITIFSQLPVFQKVELTLALDTGIPNYDTSKGEQIALNVDGSNSKSKSTDPDQLLYPSGLMDKQVLASSRSVADPSRYAVGILAGNELHLTPISTILTLRPDLKYLVSGWT